MTQPLTESEKKRIYAFCERGLGFPEIAGDLVVGRYLREFIYLQDEIERYIKL